MTKNVTVQALQKLQWKSVYLHVSKKSWFRKRKW